MYNDVASILNAEAFIQIDIGTLHFISQQFSELAAYEQGQANLFGGLADAACVIGVADTIVGFATGADEAAAAALAGEKAAGAVGAAFSAGEFAHDLSDCTDALS